MATTLQPSFGLQQPEDSMEISSEYGNNMDADIDIDLDAPDAIDTNMQSFQVDDHHMQEDPRSDRPDDLLMIDDSNLDDTDRMMQDDAPLPQEQDEELLDFSEDEEDVPMNPVEPSQIDFVAEPEVPVNQSATIEEPLELVQSNIAAELLTEGVQPIDAEVSQSEEASEQPHVEHVEPLESVIDQSVVNDESQNLASTSLDQASVTQDSAQPEQIADPIEQPEPQVVESVVESTEIPNTNDESLEENAQVAHQQSTQEQHLEQGKDDAPPAVAQEHDEQSVKRTLTRQETDLSNYTVPDEYSRERQVNSPTVTGLHPTIVEYQENEVYLFPSRDPAVPEQYLLQNENLVTTSLGDLLQACRTALGDGVSEDEELVLGVEELDLYVSEVSFEIPLVFSSTPANSSTQDSTPAFSTSFSELLDIYLQLHKLDGNDNPPPFRVSLTTKTRFSNRLASITQAISEGKGFSQLSFLQYYEYDEATELPDEDFDDEFDELAKLEGPQQLIEEGANTAESTHVVAEEEHATEDITATQAEEQQPEPTGSAQEGEYEDETSAQHDLHADTADQSEYNQDDTQYFDAQGGESELLDESHVEHEDVAHAEDQSTTGNVEAPVEDESHHEDQNADTIAHNKGASEHDEVEEHEEQNAEEQNAEEQHEYETHGDEQVFGQGEFFDENYEYQDGEVHDEEGAYVNEEEAVHNDSHYDEEQEIEATVAEEQNDNVSPSSGETLQADQLEVAHNDEQDVQQDHISADQSTNNDVADAQQDIGPVDEAAGKDNAKRGSIAVEDDDYDEINFDDEDSYDGDGAGLEPVLTNTSSKASPGAKRSFSELDQVDDEQDSKKARAS
jgi:hypothetical protein